MHSSAHHRSIIALKVGGEDAPSPPDPRCSFVPLGCHDLQQVPERVACAPIRLQDGGCDLDPPILCSFCCSRPRCGCAQTTTGARCKWRRGAHVDQETLRVCTGGANLHVQPSSGSRVSRGLADVNFDVRVCSTFASQLRNGIADGVVAPAPDTPEWAYNGMYACTSSHSGPPALLF